MPMYPKLSVSSIEFKLWCQNFIAMGDGQERIFYHVGD